MSLNRNNFNNISEINFNSTHNHFISGINEMGSLNEIVNTIPEIDKNRNMKKNNSSFQLSKNHIENREIYPCKIRFSCYIVNL